MVLCALCTIYVDYSIEVAELTQIIELRVLNQRCQINFLDVFINSSKIMMKLDD